MKTRNSPGSEGLLRFIVLIPHRDSVQTFEDYRRTLFAAGFAGAYSFPAAAPLALVSRPFSREELKDMARSLREASLRSDRGGKIKASGTAIANCPLTEGGADNKKIIFFGLPLDLDGVDRNNEKIIFSFPQPLLCAALFGPSDEELTMTAAISGGPQFSFRSAMLANFSIRPLKNGDRNYSFEWKISSPVWLPSSRRKKT